MNIMKNNQKILIFFRANIHKKAAFIDQNEVVFVFCCFMVYLGGYSDDFGPNIFKLKFDFHILTVSLSIIYQIKSFIHCQLLQLFKFLY